MSLRKHFGPKKLSRRVFRQFHVEDSWNCCQVPYCTQVSLLSLFNIPNICIPVHSQTCSTLNQCMSSFETPGVFRCWYTEVADAWCALERFLGQGLLIRSFTRRRFGGENWRHVFTVMWPFSKLNNVPVNSEVIYPKKAFFVYFPPVKMGPKTISGIWSSVEMMKLRWNNRSVSMCIGSDISFITSVLVIRWHTAFRTSRVRTCHPNGYGSRTYFLLKLGGSLNFVSQILWEEHFIIP